MESNGSVATEKKKPMTHEERMKLAAKLDEELDGFIAGLEKRSKSEAWPEDRWEEVMNKVKEMEKHPFFMSKPPEDGQLSPLMEGIQQLKYDENENTPLELAASYKEDGNFNFKYKKYRMAILSYTEGLRVNCKDPHMESQLYGNRAAAHFYLENYRSCLNDCQKALKKDASHGKAKIRAAQCCVKLKMFEDAINYCDEILEQNPEDSNAIKTRRLASSGLKLEERNKRHRECVDKILKAKFEELKSAIEKRNIQVDIEGDIWESLKSAEQKPVLDDGVLSWPVYFLYPEHSMSDFIEKMSENSRFIEHLEEMFVIPPAWDPNYEYRPEDLSMYFEGYDKSTLHSVDTRDTLSSVLSSGRYFVREWKPTFLIFVKGSRAESNFLKNYNYIPE